MNEKLIYKDEKKGDLVEKEEQKSLEKNYSKDLAEYNTEKLLSVAKYLHSSGLIPTTFKTPQQVLLGMQISLSFGYNLFGEVHKALSQMYCIGNVVVLWGELPLSIVRNKNKLESIDEYFIDENYKRISLENKNLTMRAISAVCAIKRVEEEERVFTLAYDDIEKALLRKERWQNDLKNMWKRLLRRRALKDVFPDVFYGHLGQHDFDPPDEKEVFSTDPKAIEFKEDFLSEKE